VAVGHNADDQAETVLMHFLRGAGLAGLRGMLPKTPLADYRLLEGQTGAALSLVRPLLEASRVEIEAYCTKHSLQPRFDRSNLDTTYFRNRLRHELFPYLETYRSNIREVIRRTARVAAEDYALLREVLEDAWARITQFADDETIIFDLADWRALPLGLQRATLREAVHRLRQSLRDINFVHIEDAVMVAQEKDTGAVASLPQGLWLTVGYETLTVADEDYRPLPPDWPALLKEYLPLNLPGRTPLPGPAGWRVEARWLSPDELPSEWATGPDPWQAFLDGEMADEGLALRQRRPGDRFQPQGMDGRSKSLSDFLINVKVPATWRDWVPLIVGRKDDRILWVAGWRLDERARVTPETERVLWLRFERS
jgi:tRNA(Ile)-lysidine synthase